MSAAINRQARDSASRCKAHELGIATIRADGLALLLAAARLRRHTGGRTAQLCTLSGRPRIEVDCASSSRWTRPGLIAEAQRLGSVCLMAEPLQRGYITHLYERVRREHGLREVRRTWRAGVRALRTEPRHVLNGGEAGEGAAS